jgi:hypothetical protein
MDSASTASRPLATTPRDCKAKVAINPLDWTAVPFLAFYVIVAASAFAAVFVRRRSLISAGDAGDDAKTNFIELAYLAGGKQRAADAVRAQPGRPCVRKWPLLLRLRDRLY